MAKYLMSWSGGKDSALALYHCLKGDMLNICGLVTTVNEANNRISMHGVAVELLRQQAESIGIPLFVIPLPENCTLSHYEVTISDFLKKSISDGVEGIVFGDIFLEDIRKYREAQLEKDGLKAIFPLWGLSTELVASEFLSLGFKSIVTCIDGGILNENLVGHYYSSQFLGVLPPGVDPCGENGEFHTFVTDGPIFSNPISVELGERVVKEYPNPQGGEPKRFWFVDLLSKSQTV